MGLSPLAGRPAPKNTLVDVAQLVTDYFVAVPDVSQAAQRVSFGTSGHRGSSFARSFNEHHILAITQAVCDHRRDQHIDGPLFVGIDTHALSRPALASALEVLTANAVDVMLDARDGYTPTPAVSHAILRHNRDRGRHRADGLVITPSHNPPDDGGFKYNPPEGGPAGSEVTGWVQDRANAILGDGLREVRRVPYAQARNAPSVRPYDFLEAYVGELDTVVDMEAIRGAGLHIGVDPLGGASVGYWPAIAERWGLDLTVVNDTVDPTFRFMTLDGDGRIRMDCSSPYAMAGLIERAGRFDLAFGNDTDADRHGVVVPPAGLLNPNHYLAAVVAYVYGNRPGWPRDAAVGKTVVTTAMLERIAADLGRRLFDVPVGFKWFVAGLLDGSLGFGGEESAGACLLRRDGSTWTTDKDGIVMCLLAAEMTARTGRTPAEQYAQLTQRFGSPAYRRVDAPADAGQKKRLARLTPEQVRTGELAGERITAMLTAAPGNGEPIGGLKVVTESGWCAARPSGTEDVYKVYAESFAGEEHLDRIVEDAQRLVDEALSTVPAT